MQALIGYFLLATWIAMVWMAVKLVQELRALVHGLVHPHRLDRRRDQPGA
jgi:hypothetical protein